jgi:hypothetical protein
VQKPGYRPFIVTVINNPCNVKLPGAIKFARRLKQFGPFIFCALQINGKIKMAISAATFLPKDTYEHTKMKQHINRTYYSTRTIFKKIAPALC